MLSYPRLVEGGAGAGTQSLLNVFRVFDGATWLAVASLLVAFALLSYLNRSIFIKKKTTKECFDLVSKSGKRFSGFKCQMAAEAATTVLAVLLGQGR